MGTDNKYAFQPIREALAILTGSCVVCGWVAYWVGGSHDFIVGNFETALIAIIAAEAYARD